MSAGSGFHVRNASVNLNGDSSSSSHLVATGVIVFNNLVRVWKAVVLLFLYTLVILNAGNPFPSNSAWVSGLRDSESKKFSLKIFWSDFWLLFSTFLQSHFWPFKPRQIKHHFRNTLPLVSASHIFYPEKELSCRPLPQPKKVQLHAKHFFRFFARNTCQQNKALLLTNKGYKSHLYHPVPDHRPKTHTSVLPQRFTVTTWHLIITNWQVWLTAASYPSSRYHPFEKKIIIIHKENS